MLKQISVGLFENFLMIEPNASFERDAPQTAHPPPLNLNVSMKKVKIDELRPEYRREDLGKGVRGKYLKEYRTGTNLVLLRPKVAAAFPTEKAVNDALSSLIEVAEHSVSLTRRPIGRSKTARR